MAYKNMKKNKAHTRALHRPRKATRKREEKEKALRELINKLSPPFMPKYLD